jgi:aconitate hydratase
MPESFLIDDGMLQEPASEEEAKNIEIVRGSTIVKPPAGEPLPDDLKGLAIIKVEDKITTDHIMPAGALLKYRSNVPEYAKYVFNCFNEDGRETFAGRALAAKADGVAGVIVAGDSYGQGSSREHAALCPMYLGVKVVIAKAIERIHQANLVNFAILPLTFADPADYDKIDADDELVISNTAKAIESGETVTVTNKTKNFDFTCNVRLAPRQRTILAAGGLLRYTRNA